MNPEEGPNLERLYSIRKDGSRRKLQPADVRGRFMRLRRVGFVVLMAIYLALPLVRVGGHPAVHLDIADRRFYLFGAVFNATDAPLLVFAFLSFAFGLLFVTSWLGRVWCGYACPQTVFLEGVYRLLERLIDGPGEKRFRLDAAPLGAQKIARRLLKHALFITVSLFIAHATVSLFVSTRSLSDMVRHSPAEHLEAFVWTMAIATALYFNFAWFREQLCIVVCPYGRMQSTLVDRDSLVIGYDARRGEPRGKAGHDEAGKAIQAEGRGACVDCKRCVAVCPTGIDIRNGLQLECVACAQCIDACDEVMDRLGWKRGLIRYDSQRGLEGEHAGRRSRRRWFYLALLVVSLGGLTASTWQRAPFEARLIRAPGAPFVVDSDGTVRNQFVLHLVNKSAEARQFQLASDGVVDLAAPGSEIVLRPLESIRLPIFLSVPRTSYHGPGTANVLVRMVMGDTTVQQKLPAHLLGPLR